MKITKEGFAIVERDTHLGKWVEESGRLDFDQSALGCYLKHFRSGGVLLNVGANIGCYAYAFLGAASEIICYEPNPEAYECLLHNLGGHPGVSMFRRAVSDREIGYEVRCESDNIGMAYISEREGSEEKAATIDSMGLERLDFVLIDVEGFELSVLRGGAETIRRHRPTMVIEINDHTLGRIGRSRAEIFEWLSENGYEFRNIYEGHHMDDDQLDIICFPA